LKIIITLTVCLAFFYILQTFAHIKTNYPDFNIDLTATFQYFNMASLDNLRDFKIEYADRIVFGTDPGLWKTAEHPDHMANAYNRCFRMLETDEIVNGGFFGNTPTRGLNLPREVLETIY
jgi:hypothetical protein